MKKAVLILILSLLLSTGSVNADPLFDELYYKTSTVLVPGTYTLRFSIWDDLKKGTMVWSENHTMSLTDNTIEDILGDLNPLPDIDYGLQWYVQVDQVDGTKMKPISKTRGILEASPISLWKLHVDNNFLAGVNAGNLSMTGNYNTAVGNYAFQMNTSGRYNTVIGDSALYWNHNGDYNTVSGRYALYWNDSGDYNTASGYVALLNNTIGIDNTGSGAYSLYSNTTGDNNTASGAYALYSNISGNYNTAIGYSADVSASNLTNATAIGYNATVDASNKVRIGNIFVTVIGGQVAWSNLSDMRSKTGIQDIEYGLDFVRQLRPVSFKMKNGNDRTDFGFIAQDIEALLGTEYNVIGIGEGADRQLSLRYTDFIAPMVKAMQEQQEIIETQQEEIDMLKSEIKAIKAILNNR